jgi:hypothetical protein
MASQHVWCQHRVMSELARLGDVVDRAPLAGHAGKSGAGLERVRTADGASYIVKRVTAESDLLHAVLGGGPAREYLLWREGALDRLPPGVTHAVVDAWCEDDTTVIVMRDLGERVLGWADRLSADRTRWVMARVAALHRAFLTDPPHAVAPLEAVLDQFAPHRIGVVLDTDNPLPELVQRGWSMFTDLVPRDVAEPVLDVLADVAPYAAALLDSGPVTLVHGDLATVNMALDGEDLVLLDWAMPVVAPGALDVARFVAGCSSVVALSREETIAAYREAAGPAYDEAAMRLALLLGLVWLGWNKALDAAEHPDPQTRAREREDLDWWVAQARTTLESGVL